MIAVLLMIAAAGCYGYDHGAVNFQQIGAGYCADYRYPSTGATTGAYDDVSTTAEECMSRCQTTLPGSTSFYLRGTQCGCSATTEGSCTVVSDTGYQSYRILHSDAGKKARCQSVDAAHSVAGALDCTAAGNDWTNQHQWGEIGDCPDGKLASKGFYLHWRSEDTLHGACVPWSFAATTVNYMNCVDLDTTAGSEEYVCGKVMVGHANYADANMGFLAGKRMHCKRENYGPYQCSNYKIGNCMVDVGYNFPSYGNIFFNYQNTSESWAQKAVEVLEGSADGSIPAANRCQSSTTNANSQDVDSKTLTERAIAMS